MPGSRFMDNVGKIWTSMQHPVSAKAIKLARYVERARRPSCSGMRRNPPPLSILIACFFKRNMPVSQFMKTSSLPTTSYSHGGPTASDQAVKLAARC